MDEKLERNLGYMREIKSLLSNAYTLIGCLEAQGYLYQELPFNEEDYIAEYRLCEYIDISQRTMRRIRKDFNISYFKRGRLIMYKLDVIREAFDSGVISSTKVSMEDIIIGHAEYVRKRRNTKKNK